MRRSAVLFVLLGCGGTSFQRASLATVPMVVREPAGSENLARPTAIRIDSSRFDVSASDSVTGSHRLHFERWSGTYTPGAPARLTLDLDATSIVAESRWVTDVVRSDLLEAHRFPTIRVDVNLEAVPGSSPEARLVTGNVTLHGLTRAIRFDARTTEDAKGARIEAAFAMSRSAFDIHRHDRWDSVIDDDFRIELRLEASEPQR